MITKSNLSHWLHDRESGALSRTITTANFKVSLALANRIGDVAEAHNHHPDLEVCWGKLTIRISTHDRAPGDVSITVADVALAKAIDGEVG
jgi:4a-hydroxytetrahydrobiopterin dehydratase